MNIKVDNNKPIVNIFDNENNLSFEFISADKNYLVSQNELGVRLLMKKQTVANILLNATTIGDVLLYATRPFIIGNTLYDRYIDIIVPSIKNMDEAFYTSPNQANTFAYQITNGVGLVKDNPITVNLFECAFGPDLKTQDEIYTTIDITVTAPVVPTFTQLGPYCQNATPGTLPTTSTNGITGTWSPAVISTTTLGTQTYTFTPTVGLCATTTTMSITVDPNLVPVFTALGPYCQNATPGILQNTSTNGVTGTWSPSTVSNTSSGTYMLCYRQISFRPAKLRCK